MSQWKKITIRVMRYVTLLLIVGFVALLLIYTSGSNRPFEKVEKSVEASLDKENMKRQDGTALKRNFGLIMTALCIIRRNLVFHLKKFFLLKQKVKRRPRKFQVRSKNGSKQG